MKKRQSAELSLRPTPSQRRDHAPFTAPRPVAPLAWRASSALATRTALWVADAMAFALCAVLFSTAGPATSALWIGVAAWVVMRAGGGLYDAIAHSPPDELRRSVVSSCVACLAQFATLYALGQLGTFWPSAMSLWGTLLVLPPVIRALARALLLRLRLFGAPVIVVGASTTAQTLIDELQRNPDQGLHPVAVFDDDSQRGSQIGGVPVVGGIEDAVEYDFPYPIDHALIALSPHQTPPRVLSARFTSRFAHVHVTPEFVGLANLWVKARSIGPILTFEFLQNRVTPVTLRLKRSFDLLLGALLFLLAVPVIALCALLVKLVSPGPAFFSQVREGHRGRLIRVWKVRTMVPDAEDRLEQHLKENSAAQQEWDERVKLDRDPRVIPGLGKFLRRWSLDELPQLWNVVTGTMSLVGPRPFPGYHLDRFPTRFREFRRRVPPGITGLWQVTYRTDGDLTHQQAADSFYVHNWSVWLDVWILLRTVRVVFSGSGM